ncbi:MAG: hypothetical protein ACK5HT_18250 [Draconibacterium sp.]
MHYTIKIEDSNSVAKSIVSMLKELSREYEFMSVHPEEGDVEEDIANELDARYDFVVKNPTEGDSWEEVKKRLLSIQLS